LAKKHSTKSKAQPLTTQGEVRIIAGKWRSRKITFTPVDGLRPSPSRIRETLFNWLTNDLPTSHCLDLFAGSGVLGFEALSRGAETVTLVEINRQAAKQLLTNKVQLGADDLQIIEQDATQLKQFAKRLKNKIDIVFCDPPFSKGLVQPLFNSLEQVGILQVSAKIYVETEKNLTELDLPENWNLLKEKVAGDVRYRLFERNE